MKFTIALIVVLGSVAWGQAANPRWVLVYRDAGALRQKMFQTRSSAEGWSEHSISYEAIELRSGGIVYPCYTNYDYEQALVAGEKDLQMVRTKIVGCWSKAELDDFKSRQGPPPAIGWTAN